jgi:hypothetical protein
MSDKYAGQLRSFPSLRALIRPATVLSSLFSKLSF